MTSFGNKNALSEFNQENYNVFKSNLKKAFHSILNLKNIEYEKSIKDLLTISKEKESALLSKFLFITNLSKLMKLNTDYVLENNEEIIGILNKFKIYNNKNFNTSESFKLILYLHLFSLIQIGKNITHNQDNNTNLNKKLKEINECYFILIQNLLLVLKLYKENIYSLNQILIFVDAIVVSINKNSNAKDKYINLKNSILFELLFAKYLENIANIILREKQKNTQEINIFFNYIINILKREELKIRNNLLILSHKKYVLNLISFLLNNIDYTKNIEIYNKYKDEMIKCLVNIYKYNTSSFNFFDTLINQNKESFINLVNYKVGKNLIIKDLYLQNFYIELLEKIFSSEGEKINSKESCLNILPPENSFIFNGSTSKMSFRLNKIELDNSFIFFSFQLNDNIIKNKVSCNLPLIIFDARFSVEIIRLKIYINRENNINKLIIYQEKKNEKNPKMFIFDKIGNFLPNINYFIGIFITGKRILIQINEVNKNSEKQYKQENDIFQIKFDSVDMKIGYDDKTMDYFGGYIGSIEIINLKQIKKNVNYEKIISSILSLKDLYKIFPYFFKQSSNSNSEFDIDSYLYFYNFKKEKEIKKIINFIKENCEEFKGVFHITPEIIETFYYFFQNGYEVPFPGIPIISPEQKNNCINDMDISIKKLNHIYIEFQKNNGFNFISLIFEYIYQFFSIMISKGNEFDLDLKQDKIENVIIQLFISSFTILRNFNDHKIIINNLKSYKTLFRNIFESLKKINKISNIIIQQISQQIYYLFFDFKNMQIELEKEINNNDPNEKNKKEIIVQFVEGLIDMLYNKELFLNYENENYINLLFQFTTSFIMNYIDDKDPKKILPFQPNFLYKILNLINIIENQFVSDFTKKIKIIDSFFILLNSFFKMIIKEKDSLKYFRELIPFCVINYENNLKVSYRFLKLINELLLEKYSLEKKEIDMLLKYRIDLDEKIKEEKDKKISEEINSIIAYILLKSSFLNKYDKNINLQIEQYFNSDYVLFNIICELSLIFEELLKSEDDEPIKTNNNQKSNINFMETFSNLFKFIINLFKIIINKNNNSTNKDEEENETEVDNIQNLCVLLLKITEIINKNNEKDKNKITKIYCLINYTKFLHYIIFNEINIFQISNKQIFFDILMRIIKLDSKFYISNFNQMFKVKMGNKELSKTMVEIIFEIYMNYIFNSKDLNEGFSNLIQNFNDIFIDKEFNSSIFYLNDYLRYILSLPEKKRLKKLQKDKTVNISNKLKIIEIYSINYFKNEEKFTFNFCTHFLQLILENENKIIIKNNENSDKRYLGSLINFMEALFKKVLSEHDLLFNIDKNFFSKSNSQIENEKLNFIKKHPQLNHVKDFLEKLKEKEASKEKIKETNDGDKQDQIEQVEAKEQIEDKIDYSNIKNEPFQFPKDLNKIEFFDSFDENYVWNIKKELMNNTFGLFYLDEFFYNSDFCIIKKYYINKINENPSNNSKQLNFPSILKNYKNNLESSIFIKQYNNYMTSPYLEISHNYINEELNKKLKRKNSIKLISKDFWNSESDEAIECEILKNENAHFGKLIYNNDKNYFLFKEEKKVYTDEDEYKYLFLLDFFWNHELSVNEEHKKFLKTNFNKKILILFDEIEEIIEMKVLHLWKGIEIFIKNGKSYLFNFLNTKEYETFKKDFLLIKLKKYLREKNFLNKKSDLCEYWKKGLISNYDYLLLLNRYSSRSFNDPSNYPVFPWLLNDYNNFGPFNKNEKGSISEEDKNKIRDFNYPISLQTEGKRKTAKEKFQEDVEEGVTFPIHSGCHYSTSAYIYFYLMRQQPYCNLIIKLQAYNLENTNRCFQSILNVQATRVIGTDNRELIPEFFSKIEYFLNLNCDYYGILDNNSLNLDDCEMNLFTNKNSFELSNYVNFIILHKNLLNSRIIGEELNKWIDIIFGYNQLPAKKNRLDSCNIFPKSSYEREKNLEKKLENNKKKEKTQKQIISKIKLAISQLINFGMSPYQLFDAPHIKLKSENEINEDRNEKREKLNMDEDEENNYDLEGMITNINKEKYKDLFCLIERNGIPLYFNINPNINKIFVYNKKNNLIFYNCSLFNEFNKANYSFIRVLTCTIDDPDIAFIKDNSIYQIKYGFSSFNKEINAKEEDNYTYHTYYYNEINNKYNRDNKNEKTNDDKFKIIICRHMDSTFQIHYYLYTDKKDSSKKNNKKELNEKIFSFFCEDFISSCCCVSDDTFILGLINGKLIYYKIIINIKNTFEKTGKNKKELNQDINISLKQLKYLQGHYGKINTIDIDKRLGIIITSSDDNYIIIRKLYDFELLLPIKIKKKYQVLMTKVSPYNFLYVLCFNKIKNKKVIFGYTFSGIKFAKSYYGLFDNISINENGNIITIDNQNEIVILSGSDLKILNNSEVLAIKEKLKDIKIVNWLQYSNFLKIDDDKMWKIITCFDKQQNGYSIRALNLTNPDN